MVSSGQKHSLRVTLIAYAKAKHAYRIGIVVQRFHHIKNYNYWETFKYAKVNLQQ